MICQFLDSVNLGSEELPDWEFSSFECADFPTSTKELIQNPDTGAEFYIDKTITYGDALLFWFLTIFSIGLIASIIFKYFWRK